ncbi:MAG: glycyl-radical enzyme activating protein [Bacteroidales bacterium]|nr:glycyl-radical enzyme activating protein [Bacteroidales bacterium]
MKGLIFSIRKYSIHDGPGIRVTFFMKGCPLSCWWCHNPEGISPLPEKIVVENRIGEKTFSKEEIAGKFYSVEELLIEALRDRVFMDQSGGGVTFSGGEPLMQTEFLAEALKAFRDRDFHTAVDTSGYSLPENFQSIMPYTSLFLYDLKHVDEKKHLEYTGVSNTLIIQNLIMLLNAGKNIMIRIPVIPGFNDDDETLQKIRDFLIQHKKPNLLKISLLPYHKTGSSKYRRLNIPYKMENIIQPSSERMKEIKNLFSVTGIKVKTGG